MDFQARSLHPKFAGRLPGIDAGRPLARATVRAITDAIERYSVLVLPYQHLDDDRQLTSPATSARSKHRAALAPR